MKLNLRVKAFFKEHAINELDEDGNYVWLKFANQLEEELIDATNRINDAILIAAAPEMLDLLMEMASYWAYGDDPLELDSSAISARADVLRLLCKFGKVDIEYDRGRRVIARVKE